MMSIDSLLSALRVAQDSDATGLFRFYETLLRHREEHKSSIPELRIHAVEPSAGLPLLRWEMLAIGAQPFYEWVARLAAVWEERDPGASDELALLNPSDLLAAAEQWYRRGSSARGSVIDALLSNALAPYLEMAAFNLRHHVPEEGAGASCPICGGWPDMARYSSRASRYRLICERCASEWLLVSGDCLFCGEADPDRRGFYSSEDDLYAVLVCDTCRHYLKTVDDRVANRLRYRPFLAAERLLTPGLDLTAAQEGYTRPMLLSSARASPPASV